jgi:hypothetical protein
MKKWMKTLSHYFEMCKKYENPEMDRLDAKRIYGIDKDKNLVELQGYDEIFIETGDDEGLIIDLKNLHNKASICIRSWPSYPTTESESGECSRVSIKPCAANLIEINVDR